MLIALHKNATTTPATRLALQQASGTDRELAQQYGIGIRTVRKWRGRTTVHDASHTAHRLQTTLNAGQEELVIYLRSQLLLPLDDLLAVVREFIEPAMSRSALDRLLRRRGHSRLPVQPKPEGEHEFDQLCKALGIEHRLTKPKTPQTNGMVERFNGRLSQVLRSHHFNSAEDLEKTLHRFVWLYNHHLPQKALGLRAPVQALKKMEDESA